MASTAKAQPLGLATLDADGLIPEVQLPEGIAVVDTGAAVADQAALTASAPDAITSTDAAGAAPDDDEFDALRADVIALRTTVAAVVVDLAAARTKVNALLASLRAANLIDT